jgi:16S rRNA pseudouridine516 synthase
MRLDKALAHMGYGSRKEVKRIIRQGFVRVNDRVERNDDLHINPDVDEVMVFDEDIKIITKQYIIYHKEKDVICSHVGQLYPTVYEQIPFSLLPQLHTVGRLDVDTEGLLLLTNDGGLSHRLLSPKHHVKKVYEVHLKDMFNHQDLISVEQGITLEDGEQCLPATVTVLEPKRILLTLTEGKYHQVKRMMKACNNEVLYLKRTQFGPLDLTDLALGESRLLTEDEISLLKQL